MYELSKQLIETLEREKIHYCHWKSNLLLNEALNGYDDLDLLVRRGDLARFETAIMAMGFREASNRHMHLNGVKHFYGLDAKSGSILHLHVYYQIKTGPSWIKSYRFDFEEYFLANTALHESGMKVPQKHIELVLFVFRIMLKYTKLNEFILINREQGRTRKEIEYLLKDLDRSGLESFLGSYFPDISAEAFLGYIDVIRDGSGLRKYIAALRLKSELSKYHIYNRYQELYKNMYQLIYRVTNKLFLHQKKQLHSCGMLIVIAGLDATGKTTITNDLKTWLKKNFTLSLIHFGKPRSALLTYPVNLAITMMRKNAAESSARSGLQKTGPKSFLYILRQLVLAYDRYALIKRYWQRASWGEIVICDRYKSENFGVMDSKRLDPEHYTGIKKKLALLENSLYRKMPEPDLLFYLTVPVEVAVQRNEERIKDGKESEAFLRTRHLENSDLTYKAKAQYIIDTNRDYGDVISEIKHIVWWYDYEKNCDSC